MSQELNNEAERILFEAEIRKINPDVLERWPGGQYKHHGVEGRWEGWQIARATVPAAQQEYDFAKLMMYPEEWDTAAYPTLESAMWEAISCAQIASAIDHDRDVEAIPAAKQAEADTEEDAYLINRMSKLLAGVAVALNGPEPALTRWSYHDLPERAAKLMLELELYRAAPNAPAEAASVRDLAAAARYRYLTEVLGLRFSPSGGRAIRDLGEMNAHLDAAIRALQGKPEAAKGGEHG